MPPIFADCVNRAETDNNGKNNEGKNNDGNSDNTGANKDTNKDAANAESADDGGLSTPGVNCREVS